MDGLVERVVVFALVGEHDLHLRPGAPLHELGDDPPGVGVIGTRRDRLPVGLEQLEQPLVAQRGHLDGLTQRRPPMALGEGTRRRDVHDRRRGLVKRADQVLALRRVDRRLAANA